MEKLIDNKIDVPEVSVIMPCLDEEQGVAICVKKCAEVFQRERIEGEIIVVDNGSKDNSKKVASRNGAKVIDEPQRGYGNAYLKGFLEARGKYIIMGDADDTYNFLEIPKFLEKLREGYDFVIGTRLNGNIAKGKGTMPWAHRYVGNPTLTFILRNIFGVKVSDVYCGMRGMTKDAYDKLFLRSAGMEFALEMVINTKRAGLKVTEVPINYGLRIGESKLRTLRDGWRSLRFMLLYSPKFLFLIPGIFMLLLGTIILASLIWGSVKIWGLNFDYHFMFIGSTVAIIGYQIISLGFFAKIYAYSEKFEDEKKDKVVTFLLRKVNLERMILAGSAIFLLGLLTLGNITLNWIKSDFGELFEVRKMILAVTLMIIGVQTFFNGFYYSILKLK